MFLSQMRRRDEKQIHKVYIRCPPGPAHSSLTLIWKTCKIKEFPFTFHFNTFFLTQFPVTCYFCFAFIHDFSDFIKKDLSLPLTKKYIRNSVRTSKSLQYESMFEFNSNLVYGRFLVVLALCASRPRRI